MRAPQFSSISKNSCTCFESLERALPTAKCQCKNKPDPEGRLESEGAASPTRPSSSDEQDSYWNVMPRNRDSCCLLRGRILHYRGVRFFFFWGASCPLAHTQSFKEWNVVDGGVPELREGHRSSDTLASYRQVF